MPRQKVLVIVGPTASGKSALGVKLARRLGGEIISADSRQVYRGLNIGTGKVTKRETEGIPHHLLDVVSPKSVFSAETYRKRAQRALRDIAKRGKLPIIVGGTGFYIDALLGRITLAAVPPDRSLRMRLQKKSATQLYAMLRKKDPSRAHALATPSERNNKVRLIRALEITNMKNKKDFVSPFFAEEGTKYDVLWIGISPPFSRLEKKISDRLKSRIRAGMVAEAKRLHSAGLSYKRMEALGLEYRSLARLLQKKVTPAKFEAGLYRDIRRYAKKQSAYWRRNSQIQWFEKPSVVRVARTVRAWLSRKSKPDLPT